MDKNYYENNFCQLISLFYHYIEQLNKWNITKLENALNAIGDAELLIKNNSSIRKDVIVKKLLITLCKSASSS